MNILSLFDGIACGRVALNRAGIKVDKYYASEIEPGAMKIATDNFPDIIEIGDVSKVSYKDGILLSENGNFQVGKVDLLIGGSPCTDFSSIGYANGMKSGETEIKTLTQYLFLKNQGVKFEGQSYLFWEYIRILNEIKPTYFLLENVVMAARWQAVIDEAIGCKPTLINSSLLSAQNRPRLYWTNFRITQPNDKKIDLLSILDPNASTNDVSGCQTVERCWARLIKRYGFIPDKFNAYNATKITTKACALSRGSMVTSSCATLIFVPQEKGVHSVKNGLLNDQFPTTLPNGRYNLRRLSLTEMERLQTLPDGYTNSVGVGVQKRSAAIGNGWTADVIAYILSFIK